MTTRQHLVLGAGLFAGIIFALIVVTMAAIFWPSLVAWIKWRRIGRPTSEVE